MQEILVAEIGRRSVRTDVNATGLKPMNEIKLINYDMKTVAQNRTPWINAWKKALADR